jgi:hypothetical protein
MSDPIIEITEQVTMLAIMNGDEPVVTLTITEPESY